MRKLFVSCVAVMLAFLTCPGMAAAQNISGIVLGAGVGAPPVRGTVVTMFDAANAEVLATATTGFDGTYDSGIIPAGDYRVRFNNQFHAGKEGTGAFCSADVFTVLPLNTTIVDHRFSDTAGEIGDPSKEVDPKTGDLGGTVRDAVTLAPLQGILVSLSDSETAVLIATTTTDAGGNYGFTGIAAGSVKIRFWEPSGAFFPQFFGAVGADVFCQGTPVAIGDGSPVTVDTFMNRVPADSLTQYLVEEIDSFDLPAGVEAMLATPVTRLLDLLTDNNSSNDAAACGQLTGFVSRVEVQNNKGQLSPAEADALTQSAENVRTALGCP